MMDAAISLALRRWIQPDTATTEDAKQDWETVYVYDQVQGVDTLQAPVAELFENLPQACRYFPNAVTAKTYGAVAGAILVAAILFGPTTWLLGPMGGLILGVFAGMGPGALVGWMAGPLFGPKPFWIVRRLYIPAGEVGDEPLLNEEAHAVTLEDGRIRCVSGAVHTHRMNEPLTANRAVYRATTLYDAIIADDERMDLKGGMGTWQKIQIGSALVLAGSTAGILVLLLLLSGAFD